jgi:hypothetical protein
MAVKICFPPKISKKIIQIFHSYFKQRIAVTLSMVVCNPIDVFWVTTPCDMALKPGRHI